MTLAAIVLRPADRCDHCIAEARFRMRLPSGLWLDLCRHHYVRHADALSDQGAEVISVVMDD